MRRNRSAFGSILRRRAGDGMPVPVNYRGAVRPAYYVRVRAGGREVLRKAGNSLEEAHAFLGMVQRDLFRSEVLGIDSVEERTFKDAAEEYLKAVERVHAETTSHDEGNKIRNVLIPKFGSMALSSIEARDIQRFLEERAGDVTVATRNRDLSLLSSIFRRSLKLRYCRQNPCAGIHRPKEEVRAFPYVDLVMQRKLVDACHPTIAPLVVLALETGLRQGELLRLEWCDVSLERRTLTVTRSKAKRPRSVPLSGPALDALKRLQAARGAIPMDGPDRVFPSIPAFLAGHTRRLYRAATRAAGCRTLRFHDLRHLYATNLVRAGVPITDVAKLLGHATLAMTMRYASHAPADAGSRAVALLEEFRAKAAEEAKAKGATSGNNGSARAAS